MFIARGITKSGKVHVELFFNKRSNIINYIKEVANFAKVETVVIKEIMLDVETDNAILNTICTVKAWYLKA